MLYCKLTSCAKADSSYQPGVWTCVTDADTWQQISHADSRFSKLCFYWHNPLLTDLERKGNFALLVQFAAVMGMSAQLAPDWQCIPMVQHCAGIPALILLSAWVLSCQDAAQQHQQQNELPVAELLPPCSWVCLCRARVPCTLLALPVYVCVFVSSCVPKPSLNRVKSN